MATIPSMTTINIVRRYMTTSLFLLRPTQFSDSPTCSDALDAPRRAVTILLGNAMSPLLGRRLEVTVRGNIAIVSSHKDFSASQRIVGNGSVDNFAHADSDLRRKNQPSQPQNRRFARRL